MLGDSEDADELVNEQKMNVRGCSRDGGKKRKNFFRGINTNSEAQRRLSDRQR